MKYLSVAKKWNISERSVRNHCAQGKVEGAFLTGKTWNILEDTVKPDRVNKKICPRYFIRNFVSGKEGETFRRIS